MSEQIAEQPGTDPGNPEPSPEPTVPPEITQAQIDTVLPGAYRGKPFEELPRGLQRRVERIRPDLVPQSQDEVPEQ